MSNIRQVVINFPVPVELPAGWERALDALVDMVCKAYEAAHPERTMWPAGHGSLPVWNEPEEPTFDDSVFCIDVAERAANERELARRGRKESTYCACRVKGATREQFLTKWGKARGEALYAKWCDGKARMGVHHPDCPKVK